MAGKEKLEELQLNTALTCRREAVEKKDKAYLRRCGRLIKRLTKKKGSACVLTI